jgi:hypothetical protein
MALSHHNKINMLHLSAFPKAIANKVTDFRKILKDKFTGMRDDSGRVEDNDNL